MQATFPTYQSGRLERNPFDFAALLMFLLVMTIVAAGAFWHFWSVKRIYPGVSVAGVPVGSMTRAAALKAVQGRLATAQLAPISLNYGGQNWTLPVSEVQVNADLLAAINQAYLVGRQGSYSERLSAQLMTAVQGYDVMPPLTFDEARLRQAISQIATQVTRPGRAASQIGDLAIAAQPGVTVDVAATTEQALAAMRTGLFAQTLAVPLAVREEIPSTPSQVVDATTSSADAATLTRPLLLRSEEFGLEFALDGATLEKLVRSRSPLTVDEEALRQLLAGWAEQINIPARDARLSFNPDTGVVGVLQTSQHGRQLDIDATLAATRTALENNAPEAQLAVSNTPPAVDSDRVAEMGIRELVASGTTYFKGSSWARIRNIEVPAEMFVGLVIPPDGIFSFNKVVENVTAANGFEDALIIWGDQTVVGVGGGVCQVSTTIFRAAYAAGLPIVERYNHGYIVDWYGEPGMDATIFTPSVDFKFRNDTGAYLLIDPVVDSSNGVITFNLYGTKPDRVVTIGTPVHTDVVQPQPATYTVDASLAAGQQKQVEWAKQGMTVTVQRTIVENGTTRTDTLTSKYVPWRAVYLVAPDISIPAPAEPVTTTVAMR